MALPLFPAVDWIERKTETSSKLQGILSNSTNRQVNDTWYNNDIKDNGMEIRTEREKKKSIKNKFQMYDEFAATEHLSIPLRKKMWRHCTSELHGKRTRTARVTMGSLIGHILFVFFSTKAHTLAQ